MNSTSMKTNGTKIWDTISRISEIVLLFMGAIIGGAGDSATAAWAVSLAVYFSVSRHQRT